ncbi:MAG TPA: hypothetical protein PKX87_01600 [Alphaproteobacteria bacterium]|nr:hypothetical protein [Alphaproteobacteria bacterium]
MILTAVLAGGGLAMVSGGRALAAESEGTAQSSSAKTATGNEPPQNPWYSPYGPYGPGAWWSGQGQQDQAKEEEDKKPKQIFQYDERYRAAFEHPNIQTYGPQGDTRFAHGSTDPVTSIKPASGGGTGGGGIGSGGNTGGGVPPMTGMIPETVQIPQSVDVSLAPGLSDPGNSVALRLRTPLAYSGGCWTVGPLEYEKSIDGKRMSVLVKGYRVNPAGRSGRACNPLSRYATADVPLTRKELAGVSILYLKLGTRTDTYGIGLEKNGVTLSPETMVFFKPFEKGDGGNALRQAFISGRLVALFVPAARAGEDLSDQIEDFARGRGLSPYGVAGSGDLPPVLYGNKVYYFLDPRHVVGAGRSGDPRPVGNILRKRVVREVPGSPGGVAERLDVYAAVP